MFLVSKGDFVNWIIWLQAPNVPFLREYGLFLRFYVPFLREYGLFLRPGMSCSCGKKTQHAAGLI
jgi:hypothetical protein